jgi:site-specific DNA-methyltransferase (adenine-specific)
MVRIDTGNAFDLIRKIPDESIDLMLTSPPYWQQRPDHTDIEGVIGNESGIRLYIDRLISLTGLLFPKMKPTGSMVWNLGDKIQSGQLRGIPQRFVSEMIQRAPYSWRFINEIQWIRRNPKPNASMMKRRLLPAHEPCFWFAKGEGYKFNPDGWTPEDKGWEIAPPGPRLGDKYREMLNYLDHDLNADELVFAQAALTEVIDDVRQGKLPGFRMRIRGIHKPRDGATHDLPKGFQIIRLRGTPMKRDVLTTSFKRVPGITHTAVFPEALAANLIRMLTDPWDTVLDPFAGAGTTLVACTNTSRYGIGFEIDPKYAAEARARVEGTPL